MFINHIRIQAAEKEKRRHRDAKLKEQKEISKKAKTTSADKNPGSYMAPTAKDQSKLTVQAEKDAQIALRGEIHEEEDGEKALVKKPALPTLLPLDILEDVAKEEAAERQKKRKHLRMDDFDAMAKEEEERAKKIKVKQKKVKQKKAKAETEGKKVG